MAHTRRDFLAGAAALAATGARANDRLFSGYPHQITGWTARYFKPQEFASNGNGWLRILKDLVSELDQVRSKLGQPIFITSGYRDPDWNKAVGGVPNSRHLISDAVDISLRGYSTAQRYRLATLLMQHGFTSFGTYGHLNILHADRRPIAASWHYGGGQHPNWLARAMRDTGWRRGRVLR